LAEVCGVAGEPEEGLRLIEETLGRIRGWDQRLFEAELLRLRGVLSLLLSEPNRSAAEASFRCALVAARERDARMWELRAAVDLARLWFKQGMRAEARDVLSPVHDWFTKVLTRRTCGTRSACSRSFSDHYRDAYCRRGNSWLERRCI
jgi:predicted ATPase